MSEVTTVEKLNRMQKALEEIQDLAASDNHGDNADEIHQLTVEALESDQVHGID